MSAITFTWTRSEGKAPIKHTERLGKGYCRKEEFRSALDHYIGEYEKHHAAMGDAGRRKRYTHFTFFQTFARWFGW